MCQAYEAERNWVIHLENMATIAGWIAHKDGTFLTDNPMQLNCQRDAWAHGWECRNQKKAIIPWALEKRWREAQRAATGETCYDTPTRDQADAIATGVTQ